MPEKKSIQDLNQEQSLPNQIEMDAWPEAFYHFQENDLKLFLTSFASKKVQKCAEKRSKIAVWKSIKKGIVWHKFIIPAQNYLDTMCLENALLRLGPNNSATSQPAFFPVHAKIFFAI